MLLDEECGIELSHCHLVICREANKRDPEGWWKTHSGFRVRKRPRPDLGLPILLSWSGGTFHPEAGGCPAGCPWGPFTVFTNSHRTSWKGSSSLSHLLWQHLPPIGGMTWSRSFMLVLFQIFLMMARSSSLACSKLPGQGKDRNGPKAIQVKLLGKPTDFPPSLSQNHSPS